MKSSPHTFLLIFAILFIGSNKIYSQKSKVESKATIGSITKDFKKYDGFITYYYNDLKDEIYLEIEKIGMEILYVNSLPAGIGSNDIGLDRGQLGSTKIVRFDRFGSKIILVQPNYTYRAISDNEDEKQAVEDAFAQSNIWGFEIVAEENGKVLINATSFLLRDAHGVARQLNQMKQGSVSLDASRSAIYLPRTKNFPQNSEFEAIITFKGEITGRYLRSVTPSNEAITVRMHHSFVQLPDDQYEPRVFDPRASYYGTFYYDYATPIAENVKKRFITRHRLNKKDPSTKLSEPEEPIIYYLDRGTPEPIRSALMDGARWWDQAFEAAGYSNAFQVALLPEGADPMDVRYNVINWVHRSTRGWSYGSSVTDPRTGEIIKGHVSLGSLRVRQDFLIAVGLLSPYEDGTSVPPEMEEMALARLRQLSAHEVGHTLGLTHNYTSSVDNRASVMDYPHPYVKLKEGQIDLSEAYDTKIGDWDKIAIMYGYEDFPDDADSDKALQGILAEAYNSGLSFLSDQDARPQGSAHPRAHLWDNGTNAYQELDRVMKIRAFALTQMGEKSIRNGEPFATIEEVLVPIYFFHRYQVEAATKIIGGVEYTYAVRGDGQVPTKMVAPEEQQKALHSVLNTLDPSELTLPPSLIAQIAPRPLGYNRSNEIIDLRTSMIFDPVSAAESAANMTVEILCNPDRATRLVTLHARDNRQPGLEYVLNELIENTWKTTKGDDLEGEVGRAVDMVVLRNLMALSVNGDASEQARAITYHQIILLLDWLNGQTAKIKTGSQAAHILYASAEIERFKEDPAEFRKFDVLAPPAGSPIGSGMACGN